MDGPGLYDDLCTAVRIHAEAQAAVVIVLGGNCGSGFSVQALAPDQQQIAERLPNILENIAKLMREEQKNQAEKRKTDILEGIAAHIRAGGAGH